MKITKKYYKVWESNKLVINKEENSIEKYSNAHFHYYLWICY